ncbi:YjcZ family sporulation protein [Peribacillus frigoritolerans]|nr:YjcZ family sporulation protein [Peribacillus frigoritolerans]MCK2019214.1 YjcZ family sporulation protein [Peribacillus frigoritolerans]
MGGNGNECCGGGFDNGFALLIVLFILLIIIGCSWGFGGSFGGCC